MVTYTLDDGEERHRLNPDTFWIPEGAERDSLLPGQLVKLIFRLSVDGEEHVERMWVQIRSRSGDGYVSVLDNDPYCTNELLAGAEVRSLGTHVIQVYKDGA